MGYNSLVELEAGGLKTLAAARVAAVENRHIILFGHGVDGIEKRKKVLLSVDVFLAVSGQKYIFTLFESETRENVGSLNVFEIVMENLSHGRPADIGALRCHTGGVEISTGMLAVADVYI